MKKELERIAQYVASKCEADDYILNVSYRDSHESRFAQNAITQHMAGQNINIYLETAYDNKTGSCSVNQSDESSIDYLIKTAQEIAKINQPDPEFVNSEASKKIPTVAGSADATALLAPEKMVNIIQASITNAEAKNAKVSGMTERHFSQNLTATKNGFFGFRDNSYFGHSMTMKKGDVETKVSYSSRDYATFKLIDQIKKINDQFDSLSTPKSFDPCQIPVIIRPSALMDYLSFLGWMMQRRQADEGLTAFSGQLGKQCFGEKFSLASLISDSELSSYPFSYEGVLAEDIWWIKDGVLKDMPTDRYWAKKIGAKPNAGMRNLFVPGGDASEEQMMQMVPRGLIVNRFWYIRFVDVKTGELTGMTRDGILYFEDGKVQHAVNNLRFNEIPQVMTQKILAMGLSQLCESNIKLPTILVDGFNFVDKTSF